MLMDLKTTPYSYRGSYMAFSEIPGKFNGKEVEGGLYFRSIHGASATSLVAKMIPLEGEKACAYTTQLTPYQLTVAAGDKKTEITFADEKTIIFYGDLPLLFDFMTENRPYTYLVPQDVQKDYWMADCYGENCRYMLHAQQGKLDVEQEWSGCNAKRSYLTMNCLSEGKYLVVIEEFLENWEKKAAIYDYQQVVKQCKETFLAFKNEMPAVPQSYDELATVAAYVNWESLVNPCGFLQREAMLMSKNWMCNVWSWDHCFNALALSYHKPELAWDQFMIMFDYQTENGCIPDSVNDSKIIHNYSKPPIHGFMLRKLMQQMLLTKQQLTDVYVKLSKWTNWWLSCRDNNQDGLCEYNHGNDSGWDNSTVFANMPPVTSPDLAAFLVLQMDVLSELAEKLLQPQEADCWKKKSDTMLEKMVQMLYKEGEPYAFYGLEKKMFTCDSLLLYIPIILGERLPEEIRTHCIKTLKSDKFVTVNGFATESPESPYYEADGYWRGPIWAPSTYLILEGLSACGEIEFVREMTGRYCEMMKKSGCAENYDALSGEGLRDRAYTWTASVMFILAHEYLTNE